MKPTQANYKIYIAALIFIGALIIQLVLQTANKPSAIRGQYFQQWSSETLMQTVSIIDLRNEPLKSLWFTHIQPPMLDVIRAVVAQFWLKAGIQQLILNVDQSLYILWTFVYAATGMLVFLWLAEMTFIRYALIVTVIFLLHPAHIFYATFLDTTILTGFLFLWTSYEMWKLKQTPQRSILPLSGLIVLLFLTRSIFQVAFILVYLVSLILLKLPARKIITFLIVTLAITGLVSLKQYYLFGTVSTSSFTGFNLLRSIGESPKDYFTKPPVELSENTGLPKVLTRSIKADGSINFNHIEYLERNEDSLTKYISQIRTMTITQLVTTYITNLKIFLQPSSRYTDHVIVDRLPWRDVYDRIVSNWFLILLLLISILSWIVLTPRNQYLSGIAMFIPIGSVIFFSIIAERGENLRFKYFIEPVLVVFVFTQFFRIFTLVKNLIGIKYDSAIAP